MEYFEYFWQQNFTYNKVPMFLVDFDTFMNSFCKQIHRNTGIMLTDIQKQYVKYLIDPQNQNQVYKSGFLLFVRDFWSIPSNRTKLLSMKINLSKINFKEVLKMAGQIKVSTKFTKRNNGSFSQKIFNQYLIKADLISYNYSSKSENSSSLYFNKNLKTNGYITIGSSVENCDIVIDNPFVNSEHLKIIYVTNLYQERESTPSFPVQPIPRNEVFIRDISTSCRTKQVLKDQNKMILLKKDMVIGNVGIIDDIYEIKIDSAPEAPQDQIQSIYNTMNADRISYIQGQPDKPIKKIINYNMQEISETLITDLFDRNLFYPEKSKKSPTKKEKMDVLPLKFTVRNKRTLTQTSYSSKNRKKLVIGRDPECCDIVINDISIRKQQFLFESVNDIWFLKSIQDVNIYLVANGSESVQNSNRHELMSEYKNSFCINKNIQVDISVVPIQKIEDDPY